MILDSRAPEGDGEQLLAASPVHERGSYDGHQHIHHLHSHTGQRCIRDARLHVALSLVIEEILKASISRFHFCTASVHSWRVGM